MEESRGAAATVDDVWQRHGRALYALALTMCQDAEQAEAVVVQAVLDACTPDHLAVPAVGRAELARYVYVLWQRRRGDRHEGRASLQRSAVAMGLFGDHTYREVATLMGLPAREVADLMRSGLLDATSRD
jgi:DNA-directed RNA polymerase specialized sigma24 family protein